MSFARSNPHHPTFPSITLCHCPINMICSRCLRSSRAIGTPIVRIHQSKPVIATRFTSSTRYSSLTTSYSQFLTRNLASLSYRPLSTLSIQALQSRPRFSSQSLSSNPIGTSLNGGSTTSYTQQSRGFSASSAAAAPRNTFNPSHFVRKRRHGFLSRIRSRKGRNTIKRRRLKNRSTVSH